MSALRNLRGAHAFSLHCAHLATGSCDKSRYDPQEAAILIVLINHCRLLDIETGLTNELLVDLSAIMAAEEHVHS